MNRTAIIAPVHVQVTDRWKDAMLAEASKGSADLIIVDDSNGKVQLPSSFDMYDYYRQKEELGSLYDDFEQFHKSSSCKNFGHWLAYKKGYDVIITVDSDCVLGENFVEDHKWTLDKVAYGWTNPLAPVQWFSRGYPYAERNRKISVNMGLWKKELDINGRDRVMYGQPPADPNVTSSQVSIGFIPLSGMNVAMNREIVPAFLYLPNFAYKDKTFVRHDDIWGGYIMQKILKLKHEFVSFGNPVVEHETVVIPEEDAKQEEAMTFYENDFLKIIDKIFSKIEYENENLDKMSYIELFSLFAKESATMLKGSPFEALSSAITFWTKAYEY